MAFQEVSIGFRGGQVVAARVPADQLEALRGALQDQTVRWWRLEAEGATVELDLEAVVYLRSERDEQRVGFGA